MEKSAFKRLTVMVVDDEMFIRNLIARMLRDLGIGEVQMANDGGDALGKARAIAGRLDLVVCDLEMPEMDGFAFVRALRRESDRALSCLPVLILTGHAEQENVEMAVRLGIHGFIAKPVSLNVLESRIVKALNAPAIDPSRFAATPPGGRLSRTD
ncbi:response regulator [Magnetospirillum sp. SS-4]|uniref:response regulator n=1 Tax=Magnetospirillum sp. SS-4 TaxID=2681465 RepID=UPI0013849CFE|nr:response regulator [Magnetospirillum sp. SS-4]CAA7624799.1 Putative two-component response regulator (modular protein) [Magnetospirillum sp. SS-4]